MKPVSVSELKANLSRYLRMVKRGAELQIVRRGVPVARLVGPRAQGDRVAALVREGMLYAGTGDARFLLRLHPIRATGADVSGALRKDRGDRG